MTPPIDEDRFESGPAGGPDSVAGWTAAASRMLVPLRMRSTAANIHGRMRMRRSSDVRLCHLQATAHTGVRTGELAGGAGAGHYKAAVALAGSVSVGQHGRRCRLAPGQVAVYDTSEPYEVGSELPFGVLIALLPHELVTVSRDRVAAVSATVMAGAAAERLATRLLGGTPDGGLPGAFDRAVRETPRSRAGAGTGDADLVARGREVVARHLDDPDLGPELVAAVLGVSRRRLYTAFSAEVGPVAAYVRGERMARARDLLLDPRQGHLGVADVAVAVGFPDPAHFSRVFRAAHGVPPRVYRRRHRATGS
ncbi:AraC family transcriptional regulator [Geodermatophilus sp. SYSU D01105]